MKKNKSSIGLTMISLLSIILASFLVYYIIGASFIYKMDNELSVGIYGVDYGNGFEIESLQKTNVIIPKRTNEIQNSINSNEAISITVSEKNAVYYSKNNCVLEKETNKLILGCINSVIPKETKTIADDAFKNIVGSQNNAIYYEGTIEDWCNINFENISPAYYFDRVVFLDENKEPYEIEKISFPDDCYSVSNYRFYNFKKVKEIELNNVQTIGDYAFANCVSVEELYVPDNVNKIGFGAFLGLEKLKKISLPFIGLEQNSNTHYFGNIFNKGETSANAYVPEALKEVQIRNEDIIGDNAFNNCRFLEKIELLGNPKSIGEKAFAYCTSLKTLILPGTIESIGWRILSDSGNDLDVYYGNTFEHFIKAFNKCERTNNELACENFYELIDGEYKIKNEIIIDQELTSLDCSYFRLFPFTKVLYFGSNIKNIEASVFEYVSSLEAVYFDGTLEDWLNIKFGSLTSNPKYYCDKVYIKKNGEYVLFDDFYFPENITEINAYSLVNFTNRKELIIPETVTSIGKYAFYGMENIEKLVTPFAGLNKENFEGLTYLFGVSPKELKYLDIFNSSFIDFNNLFLNDTKIEILIFGKNSTLVSGHLPFLENDTLKEIYFCNDLKGYLNVIKSNYFAKTNNSNIKFYLYNSLGEFINFDEVTEPCEISIKYISNIKSFKNINEITLLSDNQTIDRIYDVLFPQIEIIRINNDVTTISEKALNSFTNLKELYIPNSVVNISEMAFAGLKKLEKVEFEKGMKIESIPNSCFNACESLKEINIPNSVLRIGTWAFVSCHNLEKVTFEENSILESIDLKAFCDCISLKEFYIPKTVNNIAYSTFDMCKDLIIYCPYIKENCSYSSSIEKEFINIVWDYKE